MDFREKLFPIRLYTSDQYGWDNNPELAEMIWMRLRKEAHPMTMEKSYWGGESVRPADRITWYAVDCEIVNDFTVELYVYEMACSIRGGIGNCIAKTMVTFPPSDRSDADGMEEYRMIQKHIEGRKFAVAEEELRRRKEADWIKEVVAVQHEIFGCGT